jgi:OPA family sugar phosphate sensor protein UhpC-like MFS transporter
MTKRERWEGIILLTMYGMYASMMLCRNTVVVASVALTQDPTLGMDTAAYGRMMAYGSVGGLLGKLVLGPVVDRFGGRRMLLVTLISVITTTVAFGLASHISLLFFLNFFGMAVKSAGWMAMADLVGRWYSRNKHGRVWGIISTSSRVGVITSTLVLGYLLTFLTWHDLFFVAGAVGALALVGGYFLLIKDPSEVGLSAPAREDIQESDIDESQEPAAHPLAGTTVKQALWNFATSQRVWFISLTVGALTLLMDFINFIPLYLAENLGLSAGQAGMTMTAFPAGCFVAVFAGGFAYDWLSKRQRMFVFGGLLIVAAGCVLLLWILPRTDFSPSTDLYLSMAAIFTFGAAVAPGYYIPMSVFAVQYGGPRVGVLMGVIDAFGYTAAATFNYFGGSIAQTHGWDAFLVLLFCSCLAAAALVTRFMYLETLAQLRLDGGVPVS